ncbi:hypothetical protein D3C83_195260 [compost metagenome]
MKERRLAKVELIIEQWRNLDGSCQFLWSVWRDGHRIQMSRPTESATDAETQGMNWCKRETGNAPDSVTRL